MFFSSIDIKVLFIEKANLYVSLKKYFAMRPHGKAISSLLRVVPSKATLGMLSPKSLILITGSQVASDPEPKLLPLSYL